MKFETCLTGAALLLITGNICLADDYRIVQNPMNYFIDRYSINTSDDIYRFEFDINEDGLLDVFISSNNENMRSGGGMLFYQAFIATADGYKTSENAGFDLDGNPIVRRIKELGNKLAFMWYDSTGGKTTIAAIYYDESSNDLIKEEVLARLNYLQVENDPVETQKLKDQENRYIRDGLEETGIVIKRIAVVDVASEERVAEMKRREVNKEPKLSDIYDYGRIIVDEDGVHSKVALLEKGTRHLVGWMDEAGKFVPKKPGDVLSEPTSQSGGPSGNKHANPGTIVNDARIDVNHSDGETDTGDKWIVMAGALVLVILFWIIYMSKRARK